MSGDLINDVQAFLNKENPTIIVWLELFCEGCADGTCPGHPEESGFSIDYTSEESEEESEELQ